MTAPIRIVGAGPAGLTAAITLARSGRAVEVHDVRHDVGTRFTGDLQGLENWSRDEDALDELRRYGIATEFYAKPSARLEMVGGGQRFHLDTRIPGWYLVRRGGETGALDRSLRTQAEATGVVLRFRSTLPPEHIDIVATGPRPREVVGVAKGIVFETSAADTSLMLLDRKLARTGYAYLLIADGHGVLCCGIFDAFTRIDGCLAAARERFELLRNFDVRNPRAFGGVESFTTRPRWRHGRALVVGEAAGVQDLMWGVGIRTAIRSGWLAARSFLDGGDYARAAQTTLTPGIRASAVARFLWECGRVGNFEWTVRILRSRRDPVRFVRRLYTWTPVHRLLYPLAERVLRRRYPHFETGPGGA
jgi:flavin-dependent dehydrogenase